MKIPHSPRRVAGCLALCAASLAPASRADEGASPHTVTSNVGFFSNYVFRGITYTQNRPALQGGFDYAHAGGLYAGVWGTNVSSDAINDASLELDFYGGYTGTADDWSYDVGLLQFYYPEHPKLPGTRESYNTLEAYGAVGWRWLTLKYSHTLTDYFGFNRDSLGGGSSRGSGYLELNAKLPLPGEVVLGLHAGRQRVRNYSQFSYTDWRASLAKSFGAGWTASVAYTRTNADDSLWVADGKDLGEGHWIVGLSRSF
ncbi:hypothetical protein GPA22_03890 [Aromatoleum toluvorans]|uniref:Choline dehydrogenase n=1 Tax=Aromatoleum toluvorans TaxID=92002 RepID=A0ABX1PW05_9RHOO|nr:TorF family putative porin [Aromatoleum toluvorans]NMG42877.1 hypothetical protein [Aromatoleum toluvorans]